MDWHGPGTNSWERYNPHTATKWQKNPGTSTCSLAGQLLATCKKFMKKAVLFSMVRMPLGFIIIFLIMEIGAL